ncbi:bifunctional glycosyltransferase family 2/GtrA family protein [Demequina sp. SYSU T00039]|uniref:Bifunctional glycosyltransferase family 2/GtrA family protein n=1 Tax=Demequina lignilytica TaxID=3051663 RepID=A0AAW7LZP7_9MICO|nr:MULTISPECIES: bifunctional glycosyltransferase family 2/GtrA family protein [unclassified Demequina]MDN4486613.1 bifunctional glycosyltransferase family 2/GtrA family protein [Demequina sp. SYSU T00039]MDN4489299.1 bifunctional glycosyltransferase family 2/GtrA family protein [Demequina sp. SYSU T00068]
MWILIPAYEPDTRLVALVRSLSVSWPVLVVDDGSGPAFTPVFDGAGEAGAVVLRHPRNLGKAAALRTGFAWAERHAPGHIVVCADSDGQHTARDIRAVGAEAVRRLAAGEPDAIVLGSRAFVGEVPLRSRVGNRATSALVRVAAGARIADTQTGLRAIPPGLLRWARGVPGERFAYELRVLLEATRRGIALVEVPIETVYLDGNASSHFRPLADSLRVLAPVATFAASSLVAFGVDTAALLVLHAATGNLAVALAGARVLSAGTNFALNRRAVFRSDGRVLPQLARYTVLAAALLVAGYAGVAGLTALGIPLLAAKVATDLVLFAISFAVQRAIVFAPRLRRTQTSHEAFPTHASGHDAEVSRAVHA